jgi:hypothetical protein
MKYSDFEKVMSQPRMSRYLVATGNVTKSAMTLYRKNLELSQELFTVISCFEIAIRNKINQHYVNSLGIDWIRDSATGCFSVNQCQTTRKIISLAFQNLGQNYSHNKLVAKMDFGFWRYLFAGPQFFAAGASLLHIFPGKPTSTPSIQYNHTFVFDQLGLINDLHNRIAHHEPICFQPTQPLKSTSYVRQHYTLIKQLFQWMSVDEAALLYGLDHINNVCLEIDNL